MVGRNAEDEILQRAFLFLEHQRGCTSLQDAKVQRTARLWQLEKLPAVPSVLPQVLSAQRSASPPNKCLKYHFTTVSSHRHGSFNQPWASICHHSSLVSSKHLAYAQIYSHLQLRQYSYTSNSLKRIPNCVWKEHMIEKAEKLVTENPD